MKEHNEGFTPQYGPSEKKTMKEWDQIDSDRWDESVKEKKESEGGFLVPKIIRTQKAGIRAMIARFLNLSWGWEDFDLHKALYERMGIDEKKNFS